MKRSEAKSKFLAAAYAITGGSREITRPQVVNAATNAGLPIPAWFVNDRQYRVAWGRYRLPAQTGESTRRVAAPAPTPVAAPAPVQVTQAATLVSAPVTQTSLDLAILSGEAVVPTVDPNYVPWGNHDTIYEIVKSGRFFPVYVWGLSGNGKTFTTEQVCAMLGREYYRVNITPETCEDDLLGGFRLVGGETKFVYGPVSLAMERGGVLLLDEVDLGSDKIMALQPVLEGKPVFLKKINKWVRPAPGFTVVMTGNTKGLGDETGKFAGTRILNTAFLERVNIMLKQEYPKAAVEKKILTKMMESSGCVDEKFADALVKWAEAIRKTYDEGVSEEVITTRRLVQIVSGYCIFKDRLTAVRHGVGRFDDVTSEAFLNLYKKIDAEAEAADPDASKAGSAPVEEAVAAPTTKAPF
jgi:MoxR-like ATPase